MKETSEETDSLCHDIWGTSGLQHAPAVTFEWLRLQSRKNDESFNRRANFVSSVAGAQIFNKKIISQKKWKSNLIHAYNSSGLSFSYTFTST